MEKTTGSASPGDARAKDAQHVARSGVLQLLSALGQGLMPVTHILVANLYGKAVFGAYQAAVAILDLLTRAGQAGSMGGMHRFIAAHRAAGDEDLTKRALGTGIRLTVGVSSVLALALALLARPIAHWWREPSLTAALPIMAPAVLLAATTLVLVNATLGAKVARMSLYVRGIGEPMLWRLALVGAWRLGGRCATWPSRTSRARSWSARWRWRRARACSARGTCASRCRRRVTPASCASRCRWACPT